MAINVKQAVGNYAESLYYATVDSSGYLLSGTDTTGPAAGSADGSAMTRLRGLQDFPFEPDAPDSPVQTGDGGVLARFQNKPRTLPESALTFGASDFDFDKLANGLEVVTIGGGEFIGRQPETRNNVDMMLMAMSNAKDLSGNTMWEARIIHKINATSKGRNSFNDSSLPTYGIDIVANFATAFPWGTAFVAATNGDTLFVYHDFTWPYRPIIERWTGNNALTTFNLTKDIAEDSSDNIAVWENGVELTWVASAPSAGEFGITESTTDTIVFGTAPASDAKVVALYGWA